MSKLYSFKCVVFQKKKCKNPTENVMNVFCVFFHESVKYFFPLYEISFEIHKLNFDLKANCSPFLNDLSFVQV